MAKNAKTESTPVPEAKKKLPLKTVLILVGALVLEAAVIAGVFMLAGGPTRAKAEGAVEDRQAESHRSVELLVIEDRFPNNRRGVTYLYDTRVFVVVRKMHEEDTTRFIESAKAQISNDIRLIISQAEPSQLLEPTLATLTRQIRAALDQRIPVDEEGKSRIEEVLIPKFIQIKANL